MCGINGQIIKGSQFVEIKKNLDSMNKKIIHRGPDDDGFFIYESEEHTIGMAMRRLSIIDLENGSQPISNDDKSLTIVFNGEIYNFKEIRKSLKDSGMSFSTECDTEVVLKLYEKYGIESFGKLDGMFGCSIFDKKRNIVVIARDFFGEKPLYYTFGNDGLIWGSELKSIVSILDNRPSICQKALNMYFQLTYIPAPFTIYDGIKKLESNNVLEYDLKSNEIKITEIEQLNKYNEKETNYLSAKRKVKELVFESVKSRSVSDVAIGSFLSGGVDSSIVSLCLASSQQKPISTFSIGFTKSEFDETKKSREVAKLINSNHHEFILEEKDLNQDLTEILDNFDEPFADSSAIPSYLVAKMTSEHVKVALTGDGGDEIFGGYNKYLMGRYNKTYTSLIPEFVHNGLKSGVKNFSWNKTDDRGFLFKAKRVLDSIDYEGLHYYSIISLGFQKNELNHLLKNKNIIAIREGLELAGLEPVNSLSKYRLIDKRMSLEGDMLVKVDRTSMLNSLECRAPFLNKSLWNYSFSLPEEFLLNGNSKKKILKDAFSSEFPKGFLELGKKGFGVPVGDWLRGSLKKTLQKYSEKKMLAAQGIFETEFVTRLVDEHLNGIKDHTFKLWTFYCFQNWYFTNMER